MGWYLDHKGAGLFDDSPKIAMHFVTYERKKDLFSLLSSPFLNLFLTLKLSISAPLLFLVCGSILMRFCQPINREVLGLPDSTKATFESVLPSV